MTLTQPDFTIPASTPNPSPNLITDAEWWLWLRCKELQAQYSEYGGIIAWKRGFHAPGEYNQKNYPDNYSIRDAINRSGPGWTKASAFDWTFDDAQHGDFKTINKYTSRLVHSSLDPNDPRLDMVLFEFYGNADTDREVEGRNEYRETNVTSDSSHLWHLHFSFLRSMCGDFWGMWALLTVLMGWTVAQWKASLPVSAPKPTAPKPVVPSGIPTVRNGSRALCYRPGNLMKGTDVLFVQKWIGSKRMGKADGIAGPMFKAGVIWYQKMRGLKADGIVGPKTWAAMGVR